MKNQNMMNILAIYRNAEIMVKNIEKAIEQLDSDNAKVYQTNAENYIKKLDTLDKQYANTIQNAKYKAILFGDRFPFRYMADDYDLSIMPLLLDVVQRQWLGLKR